MPSPTEVANFQRLITTLSAQSAIAVTNLWNQYQNADPETRWQELQEAFPLVVDPFLASAAVLSTDQGADPAGTGDFNGDGRHDLLWRNTAATEVPGIVVGWLMNDGTIISTTVLGGDLSWAVNNTADVNGDGKTDILWREAASGGTVAWLMNSFNVLTAVVLGGDTTWTLIRRPGVHPA